MAVSIRALRYCLAAMERRSIAGAAAALSVAPSAIGAALDSVEATLGLTLVHRRRARGLEPTPAGPDFARRAGMVLEEYDGLLNFGAELGGGFAGALRIGYYAPVAPAFLPTILAPLLAGHPGLTAHLTECDTQAARGGLLDGTFDAILFLAGEMQAGIDTVPLIEAAPYLLVPEGDPLDAAGPVPLAALDGRAVVMLDLPVVRAYYDALFEEAGIAPRTVATGTTHEMVRSLVGAGIGPALLNMRPMTAHTYGGGTVRAVPFDPPLRPLSLVLGTLGARRRVVQAFVEACADFFASEAARGMAVGGRGGYAAPHLVSGERP